GRGGLHGVRPARGLQLPGRGDDVSSDELDLRDLSVEYAGGELFDSDGGQFVDACQAFFEWSCDGEVVDDLTGELHVLGVGLAVAAPVVIGGARCVDEALEPGRKLDVWVELDGFLQLVGGDVG